MKAKLLLISLFATSTFAAVPSDIKKQQHDLKCRHIEHIYDWTIQMAGSTGYLDAVSNMPINIRNAQFNKMMNSMVNSVVKQTKIEPTQSINAIYKDKTINYPYKIWNGELTWNKIAAEYGKCAASYR